MKKKSNPAVELNRLRWSKIPPADRARHVPRNGGRKRVYPPCPRYKAHRFTNDRCPCGYERTGVRC